VKYLENYMLVDFLRWMAEEHPEIPRGAELEPDKVNGELKEAFEKAQKEKGRYEGQWSAMFAWYAEPRKCGRDYVREVPLDPLERYRRIPLHALFLYTSQAKVMDSYLEDNWCLLHKQSANYCDIYPVKSQHEYDHDKDISEDATDFLEKSKIINTKHAIDLSDLPGMFFWNHRGETEYISFLDDKSYDGLSKSINIIFKEIKKDPTIHAVRRAKRKVEKQKTLPDLFKGLLPQSASVWSLIGVGLASLAIWAAFASTGSNNFFATIAFIIGLAFICAFLLILVVESLLKIWVSRQDKQTSGWKDDKPTPENLSPEQLARLWEHRLHVEKLFYSRLSFFLAFETILLGVVGALYSKNGPPIFVLRAISVLGLCITLVWLVVQHRHRHIFNVLDKRAKCHFAEYCETVKIIDEGKFQPPGKNPAIWLLTYLVPFLLVLAWVFLLLFLFQWLPK
jgi:hypothetical protein